MYSAAWASTRSPANRIPWLGSQATMSPSVCPRPQYCQDQLAAVAAQVDGEPVGEGRGRPGQAGNRGRVAEQPRHPAELGLPVLPGRARRSARGCCRARRSPRRRTRWPRAPAPRDSATAPGSGSACRCARAAAPAMRSPRPASPAPRSRRGSPRPRSRRCSGRPRRSARRPRRRAPPGSAPCRSGRPMRRRSSLAGSCAAAGMAAGRSFNNYPARARLTRSNELRVLWPSVPDVTYKALWALHVSPRRNLPETPR